MEFLFESNILFLVRHFELIILVVLIYWSNYFNTLISLEISIYIVTYCSGCLMSSPRHFVKYVFPLTTMKKHIFRKCVQYYKHQFPTKKNSYLLHCYSRNSALGTVFLRALHLGYFRAYQRVKVESR